MTSPEKTKFWASLTRAQITAWLLCGVLVLGTGLGGAYVALRVASARAAAPVQAAVATPAPAAQPAVQPTPVPAPPPAPKPAAEPVPATVPVPPPPRVEAPPSAPPSGIQPGRYLQVGAIDRPAVRAYMNKLTGQGFKAFEAEGPNANTVRILIGPLSPDEIEPLKAKVEAAGFPCFARRY